MELWWCPGQEAVEISQRASLLQYVRKQKAPIRVKITDLNYTVYVSPDKEGAKVEQGALDSETGAGPGLKLQLKLHPRPPKYFQCGGYVNL